MSLNIWEVINVINVTKKDCFVFNSIHQKKCDSPKTWNGEKYDVICGLPLRDIYILRSTLDGLTF